MSQTINLFVKNRTHSVSKGIQPLEADKGLYDIVPLCKCPTSKKRLFDTMSIQLQKTFTNVINILQNKYGTLKTTAISKGEGSFGVVINVATLDEKHSFIIKVQKCKSCNLTTNHSQAFMREINAVNKIITDKTYKFLLPYICGYYPTQKEAFWFEDRKNKMLQIEPNKKNDAASLGVIVMRQMERALIIDASERDDWTKGSLKRGAWLSFVWSGSLLGIIGELLLSNAFHGDIKEDNIVGSKLITEDPFSYVWKAIDWGGAGKMTNRADFESSMYTPHYQPLRTIQQSGTLRNYISMFDVLSMAHIIRNLTIFMMSSSKHKTPYSQNDNTTRFFYTSYNRRNVLTSKVIQELTSVEIGKHEGLDWCILWMELLIKPPCYWKKWDVNTWWRMMATRWLRIVDTENDKKKKDRYWSRIPIVGRIRKLRSLLK